MAEEQGEPTDAPGQGRPAGPGAEGMTAEGTIGDRPPPPDPDAPANGVIEDQDDPPEPNEPG